MQKSRKLFLPIIAIPLVLIILLVVAPLASTPTLATPINALLDDTPGPLPTGYCWTYNVPINETYNATWKQRVVGNVSIEDWYLTPTQCYKIKYENPLLMPVNETWSYVYLRVSDQKQIATENYMLMNYSGMYYENYQFSYTDVPIENGYPLSVGKFWNQTITANMTGYTYMWTGVEWWNETYTRENATQFIYWMAGEVLDISNVTVPAGTFETWCINISNGNPISTTWSIAYFSPDVKNFVLATNSTGGLVAELVSYGFGPALAANIWWLIWGQLLQQIMSPFAGRNLFLLGGAGAALILVSAGIIIWWRRR